MLTLSVIITVEQVFCVPRWYYNQMDFPGITFVTILGTNQTNYCNSRAVDRTACSTELLEVTRFQKQTPNAVREEFEK